VISSHPARDRSNKGAPTRRFAFGTPTGLMSRRTERVANLLRNTIGQLLLTKLSDPRVDPARTSVTRVEVPDDLLTAKVYVSVIGTEAEQRRTLRGLQRAAGRIQALMKKQVQLRHTPVLHFVLDETFKKALRTLEIIQETSEELRRKDEVREASRTEGAETDPRDDQ